MTAVRKSLIVGQYGATAEVVPAEPCHVVLDASPPSSVEKISRYIETSVVRDKVAGVSAEADSSDSGDSLFLTQKAVPDAVRSRRRRISSSSSIYPRALEESEYENEEDGSSSDSHGESKTHKGKKKTYTLPKYHFPFLPDEKTRRGRPLLPDKHLNLHSFVMGGFFKCVAEMWQGYKSDVPRPSLPTVDTDEESISPLSEEDKEGSEDEDIKVVEKKCFLAPSKAKRRPTWCNQITKKAVEEEFCNNNDTAVCEPSKLTLTETQTDALHMDDLLQTGQAGDVPGSPHSLPDLLDDTYDDRGDHEGVEENWQSQKKPESATLVNVEVEETPRVNRAMEIFESEADTGLDERDEMSVSQDNMENSCEQDLEEPNKTCQSSSSETTDTGMKRKKKCTGNESVSLTPMEKLESEADTGLSPPDGPVVSKKEKMRNKHELCHDTQYGPSIATVDAESTTTVCSEAVSHKNLPHSLPLFLHDTDDDGDHEGVEENCQSQKKPESATHVNVEVEETPTLSEVNRAMEKFESEADTGLDERDEMSFSQDNMENSCEQDLEEPNKTCQSSSSETTDTGMKREKKCTGNESLSLTPTEKWESEADTGISPPDGPVVSKKKKKKRNKHELCHDTQDGPSTATVDAESTTTVCSEAVSHKNLPHSLPLFLHDADDDRDHEGVEENCQSQNKPESATHVNVEVTPTFSEVNRAMEKFESEADTGLSPPDGPVVSKKKKKKRNKHELCHDTQDGPSTAAVDAESTTTVCSEGVSHKNLPHSLPLFLHEPYDERDHEGDPPPAIERLEEENAPSSKQKKKKRKRKKSAAEDVGEKVNGKGESNVREENYLLLERFNVEECAKEKKKRRRSGGDVEQLQSNDAEIQNNKKRREEEGIIIGDCEDEATNRSSYLTPEQFEDSVNCYKSSASPQETLESSYVKRKKHKKKHQPTSEDKDQEGENDADVNLCMDDSLTVPYSSEESLKKKKKKKTAFEGIDVSYTHEENEKVENLDNTKITAEDFEGQNPEPVTKKKKKKKKKMSEIFMTNSDMETQNDDSVSVWEKETTWTSSFLVADAEEQDAETHVEQIPSTEPPVWGLETHDVSTGDLKKPKKKKKRKISVSQDNMENSCEQDLEELNKTCQSSSSETTDTGLKRKKEPTGNESVSVTPMEKWESEADTGLSPPDGAVVSKKKKKKKNKHELCHDTQDGPSTSAVDAESTTTVCSEAVSHKNLPHSLPLFLHEPYDDRDHEGDPPPAIERLEEENAPSSKHKKKKRKKSAAEDVGEEVNGKGESNVREENSVLLERFNVEECAKEKKKKKKRRSGEDVEQL